MKGYKSLLIKTIFYFIMEEKKEELVEEIDWEGNVINIHKKSLLKEKMFPHKVSVIIPKANFDKVVLCRRAKDQYPFPDTWCCAVGGKVIAGESEKDAAIREMKEEIGVELEIEEVTRVKYDNSDYKAIFYVFTTKNPVNHDEFKLDLSEIQFTKEFNIDEILDMIKNNPEEFAPTFREILKDFAKKQENYKDNFEKIFDFLQVVCELKKAKRYGKYDIDADSSADHSWRLALMVHILSDELKIDINVLKAMKIALVHDLPEAITGDTPYMEIHYGNMTKEAKQIKEIEAISIITKLLPEKIGKEIFDLWEEYEYSKSKEALFVKALDKIETITHVVEKGGEYTDLDLVATYPDKHVKKFPELLPMLKELKSRLKKQFEKRGLEWKKEYDEY